MRVVRGWVTMALPGVCGGPVARRAARRGAAGRGGAVRVEAASGVARNPNIAKLQAGYLFPEIARLRNAHLDKNPDAKIISLGIGDTTEPIPPAVVDGLVAASQGLGTLEGYSGYGAEQGQVALREKLVGRFYEGMVESDEVFVSDGSKCDISRLQMMFGNGRTVAVQDPSYPAYVDTSVMMGHTEGFDAAAEGYGNIKYLKCDKDNGFFPDLEAAKGAELLFFCSPNNPTGAAATRAQLTELVEFAKANGSIIIFDAAYAIYIEDEDCPRTIYEIPGATEVAIETCSFSKYIGFTGVRLGWTVVPKALKFADGSSVNTDWNRVMCTCFNGASNVAQAGGLACLEDSGWNAMLELVAFYKENARMLYSAMQDLGFEVYGGTNAPYVWVVVPGKKSWDVFSEILTNADIVCTPGSGFGPGGEGAVRLSAFGHRENILEAIERLQKMYAK